MTTILPPHESDVLARLLQNLCSAALVSVQGRDSVLQPAEAVLDVVPPLPLQLVVMGSPPVVGQLRRKAENIIFVLKQNLLIIAKKIELEN